MPTDLIDETTIVLEGRGSAIELELPSGGSSSVGLAAIHRGLKTEEAARARTIGLVFFLVCVLTALWAPLLDGHPALKIPLLVVVGWFGLSGLYVFWLASVPERYTR